MAQALTFAGQDITFAWRINLVAAAPRPLPRPRELTPKPMGWTLFELAGTVTTDSPPEDLDRRAEILIPDERHFFPRRSCPRPRARMGRAAVAAGGISGAPPALRQRERYGAIL